MKPRSHFRFTLRTFFVLLTLAACALGWLGVQVQWIKDRHEAREWCARRNMVAFVTAHPAHQDAPLGIRLLGEEGYDAIYLDDAREDGAYGLAHFRRLFPEAKVQCIPGDLPQPPSQGSSKIEPAGLMLRMGIA